jgi:hypothetical protein
MRSIKLTLFFTTVLIGITSAFGSSATPVIEPSEVLLAIGQSQTFQLLGTDGNEVLSREWNVSDPEIAEIMTQHGHAVVTGKAPGVVMLFNASGVPAAEIHVHAAGPGLPNDNRWILHPLDGQFVHALWASGTWGGSAPDADAMDDNHPSYFYQDWGTESSHVRAIRDDGLQVWQWPRQASNEMPRMICGDIYGGALVFVGEPGKRVLVDLNARGRERWRTSVPGFDGKSFSFAMTGTLYIVENSADGTTARIVALDAKTGQQQLSIDLTSSQETLHNLSWRNGSLICSPGSDTSTPLPLHHSKMMSNTAGVANLAYSEYNVIADGGNCKAGSMVDIGTLLVKATTRLMMIDISSELTTVRTPVVTFTASGPAGSTWIQTAIPTGDIIVGEVGTGNFLAVRETRQLWHGAAPGTISEFQYRINDDRTVKYRVPVPVSPEGVSTSMLLGENFGYTTRGTVVIAFELQEGREVWRWEGTENLSACIAVKGDKVLVREGDGYTIVGDGRVDDRRAEDFMLFVQKFRPDPETF